MPKATADENELPPAEEVDVNNLFSVKGKVCVVTGKFLFQFCQIYRFFLMLVVA